ncbi:MAG: glutathione synthase [Pseudomonadota bacterium]
MTTNSQVIALQMDPLESVDIHADTTFCLALEAQNRGYCLFHYDPSRLSYDQGHLWAEGHRVRLQAKDGDPVAEKEPQSVDLSTVAVILLRQDPPFDMGYITSTYLLDLVRTQVRVVNDPTGVRTISEKLGALPLVEVMPPTLVTRSRARLDAFRATHKDIIVKPLYGNGGAGVFRVTPDDGNYEVILEQFFAHSREPIMAQQFLAAVKDGDRRVLFIDGEAVGAIDRIPASGQSRANLHVGGKAHAADLSVRDRDICAAVAPILRTHGLFFAGIDIIGGYLTEINVTSPTGIQEYNRLNNAHLETMFWDRLGL